MKTLFKITTGLIGILVTLYAALFIALSIYNTPVYAWRILTLFSSDTQDDKVFPSRQIETVAPASPIEQGDPLALSSVEYRYPMFYGPTWSRQSCINCRKPNKLPGSERNEEIFQMDGIDPWLEPVRIGYRCGAVGQAVSGPVG